MSRHSPPEHHEDGDATTLEGALDLVRQHGGRITSSRRLLDELEKLGVIVHSHLGHGPATYHLARAIHGHFVCEECGKMIEAPEALFSSLARSARVDFGFTIDPHHSAMLGRCADCS